MVLSIVFITTLMLVACSDKDSDSGSDNDGKKKVAVVLKSFDHENWRIAEAGAKQAGEEFGIDVEVMAPAVETEVDQQISLIEDQLTNNVDALVLAPSQPTTVINPLQQYTDKVIPVVFIDSDADYEEKTSFVGTANYEAGKLGGQYLGEELSEGDEVAIIRGPLGSTTHDERSDGAEEEMEKAGLNVVTIQSADADKAKAINVMENILQSNPNVKAVFNTSETMALGALRATEGTDIIVVGFDGNTEGLESIRDGGIDAIVAQHPYDMGYKGVEAAFEKIEGKDVDVRIDTGADVITKENVDEALERVESYKIKE